MVPEKWLKAESTVKQDFLFGTWETSAADNVDRTGLASMLQRKTMSSLANWLEAIYVTLRQRIWLLFTQVLRTDKKLNYKVMDYSLWL